VEVCSWRRPGHRGAARGVLVARRGQGGEDRVVGSVLACRGGRCRGQGTAALCPKERGERGEHGGGLRGAGHCRTQCSTVASGDGAGEVFVKMPARGALFPFALKFGGEAEGSEGSLVRCSGGQGELIWCTKLKWSCEVLFVSSNFANLV